MMFFLRSAFFLTIVYVSIALGAGALHRPHAFEAAVASETSRVAKAAVAGATDWCAERPARCARDAARLTALVEMTAAEPSTGGDQEVFAEEPRISAHGPRHHASGALLTGAR